MLKLTTYKISSLLKYLLFLILKAIKIYACSLKGDDNERRFKHHSSNSKTVPSELSRIKTSSKFNSLLNYNLNNYCFIIFSWTLLTTASRGWLFWQIFSFGFNQDFVLLKIIVLKCRFALENGQKNIYRFNSGRIQNQNLFLCRLRLMKV